MTMASPQSVQGEGFLTPGTYRIPVETLAMPGLRRLEEDFPGATGLEAFAPTVRWHRHPLVPKQDEVIGSRIMVVTRFELSAVRSLTVPDAAFAELVQEAGLRPATHLEAYALTRVLPPPEREYLIAPGSFRTCPGGRIYVRYRRGPDGRLLDSIFTPGSLGINHMFLLVEIA